MILIAAPRVVDDERGAQSDVAPPSDARMLFVGDVMLGRSVEKLMERYGRSYPFASSTIILYSADIVIANFEGTIPDVHQPTASSSVRFSFMRETADTLAEHNIKLVTLGNNHSLDFGAAALQRTREVLWSVGVASVGEPLNSADATTINFLISGLPVVLVSLNDTWGTLTIEDAVERVKNAQRKSSFDDGFVIVSVHWGGEYEPVANVRQRELAAALTDAGADLIIGHHPHVVQDVERIGDSVVLYSLGNFVFDQYFSNETQEGLAALVNLHRDNARVELIPIQSARSQPVPVSGSVRDARLLELASRSSSSIRDDITRGVITWKHNSSLKTTKTFE